MTETQRRAKGTATPPGSAGPLEGPQWGPQSPGRAGRVRELIKSSRSKFKIVWRQFNVDQFLGHQLGGWVAEWSGEPVSLPAVYRLRVRFPSPPGHATLPTTGASVNAWYNLYEAVTGRWTDMNGAMVGSWQYS